jgi:hypothetical protein
MQKNRRTIVLFSLLMLVSLGCNFIGQMLPGQATSIPGAGNNRKPQATPVAGNDVKPQPTPASGNTEEPLAIPGVYPAELTAPFPAPLQLSGSSPDETAAALAKAVLADDQDSFAVLLAAFQENGIAIRSADGGLANKPAEPWQGLIYEAWEMRLLFNMVHRENFVTINLVDLTDTLRSVMPELDKAPLAQLLVEDLQTYAQSDQPTMRFWARFIVELGKQAQAHPSYDLLEQVADALITPSNSGYHLQFSYETSTISGVGGTIPFRPKINVYQPGFEHN